MHTIRVCLSIITSQYVITLHGVIIVKGYLSYTNVWICQSYSHLISLIGYIITFAAVCYYPLWNQLSSIPSTICQ